jgi:hypothetical protein
MRSILPLFIATLLTSCCFSQGNGTPQTQCSITGTVTDSSTGQAIKGAEVMARAVGPRVGLPLRPASSTSDNKGEFVIERLDCGRYAVRAFRDGYIVNGQPTILTLSPGQHVDGVSVLLTPGGVISGHVVDEAGKALSGASVELMKYAFTTGRRDLNVMSNATTNKAGEYRIEGLAPGQYYLRANVAPRGGSKASRDAKTYVPIYFPNATDLARASTLEIRPAQELAGMDLNLSPVRTVGVSGLVTENGVAKAGAEVTLLSDDGYTNFPGGQTSTDKTGRFEFFGLTQGAYVIVAQSASDDPRTKVFWGQAPVNVEDANVNDFRVSVDKGEEVVGRLHVDSAVTVELGKMTASLESQQPSAVRNLLPELEGTSIAADGVFRFRNVPTGTYSLSLFPLPTGSYLRSSGTPDVLEGGVTVGSGPTAPLDITLSSATARVDGTISNDDASGGNVIVVLIPEGRRRSQFSYYHVSPVDKANQFSLRAIPPGEYKIFAWVGMERREYMNPDFLRAYENQGRSVHLEDGSRENVQLEVIVVNETNPQQ